MSSALGRPMAASSGPLRASDGSPDTWADASPATSPRNNVAAMLRGTKITKDGGRGASSAWSHFTLGDPTLKSNG